MPADDSTLLTDRPATSADGPTVVVARRDADPTRRPEAVDWPDSPFLGERGGERLGPWRLTQPLGAGGMGEVWEALRDDGAYEARVAVKLLPAGADGDAGPAGVRAEMRALARLNHPHIARLLDAGRSADGRPYFVMEAIDGRTIDEACRGQPLAVRLRTFLQLTDAVAHAHRQGLVHRDLKPSNVLVDGAGQVKLLDFGIALARDLSLPRAARVQGVPEPALALTPAFASPEQVRGERVGAASDVYALGVLLHLLLTGVRPYGRGALSQDDWLRAVLEEAPSRPSRAPPRGDGDPGVSRRLLRGDLDAVVLKAMSKTVAGRYGSVDALADDLRAVLARRPVSARRRTPAIVAARFVSRHRVAVAAVAWAALAAVGVLGAADWPAREALGVAGLVVLALALGVSLWQAREAASARDEARARLAETSTLVRDVLMRHADLATYLPGGLTMKAELLTDAIAHLERLQVSAPGDAALSAELAKAHARLADLQLPGQDLTLDQPDECRAHAERALALFPAGEPAQRQRADFVLWWARAMRCQAHLQRLAGETEGALAAQQRLTRFLQAALPRFPGDYGLRVELGSTLIGTALVLDTWQDPSLGRSAQALEVLGEAQRVHEALHAERPDDGDLPFQLGTIAGARMIVLKRLDRQPEALEAGREAVRRREQALALRPDHTAYREGAAGEANNLASQLLDAGRAEEAVAVTQRGEALMRALEAEDPAVATWTQRRRWFALHAGRALLATDQAAQAVPRLEEALKAMPDADGWVLTRRGLARLALARARARLGETSAAAEALALALADLRRRLDAAPGDAEALRRLAEAGELQSELARG